MPVGYGYQSREDSSYVNWAEVAKGFTDVIDADIKTREDKKAAYDKQDRDLAKTLAEAPMGQYKDGNDFTANYVDAMTKQRLIDSKLFKAGKLKERDYTLKTNNAIDGTNTLFDLQKKYQEEYKTKMAGLADNSLQALNGFNMANTEGFADFSKTRAMLDPIDGKVKLMKMKFNEKTGIMEPTQDIVPVGTLMRNMSTNIPTFDLDGATTNDVKNMGELKTSILQAATLGRAGSVTSFVNSPEMFEKTFPGGKAIVEEFNKAITNNVNKYLSIPYNLTSILTQNTGKYDAESFTYNKDEAAKDPSKILLKINPNTGLPIMDEDAPNYAKQREEAFGLAKNQILSKLDREKQIQTSTGQLDDKTLSRKIYTEGKEEEKLTAANLGEQLGKYLTGDLTTAKNSNTYLRRYGVQSEKLTVKQPDGTEKKIVRFYNSAGESFDYDPTQKTPELIKSAVSGIGDLIKSKELSEDEVINAAIKAAGGKSVTFDVVGKGYEGPKSYAKDINSYVSSNLDSQIIPQKATETAANLNAAFGGLGFTFEPDEGTLGTTDDVIIYKKGQDTSKEKGVTFSVDDKSQVQNILNWLTQNANATEAENFFVNNPDKQATPTTTPKAANPKGVGSKY